VICSSCGLRIFADWHAIASDRRGLHHAFCYYDTTMVVMLVPRIRPPVRRPIRISL